MSDGFLGSVVTHFEAFASRSGVGTDDLYVRLHLVDGTQVNFKGLHVDSPPQGSGSMVRGARLDEALVIREEDIVKAEFQSMPQEPASIGFHAEMSE